MTCRELQISYYLDEDRERWNGGGGEPPPAYPQEEVELIARPTGGFAVGRCCSEIRRLCLAKKY